MPLTGSASQKLDSNISNFVFFKTDQHEVFKVIGALKTKTSSGHHSLSNKMIKLCSPVISVFLANILNKCTDRAYFPDACKIAKIVAFLKKGDKEIPSNYQPISLLTVFSKIFEKLNYKRMPVFINKNNIIIPEQFGFREKHSCIHAILRVTEFRRKTIETKNMGLALFIDLRKAFHTVNHCILLEKLCAYGFRSYLTNRQQFVVNSNGTSRQQVISYGVPQGSVLGPLFFLLYINDINKIVSKSELSLFADNTAILASFPMTRVNDYFKNDLLKTDHWCVRNKLSISSTKCKILPFGKQCLDNDFSLAGENIGFINCFK